MPGPILYSTNPWFATEIAEKYRRGNHFAWLCEYFDSARAPAGTAAALIAPNSNPRRIYEQVAEECRDQEENSFRIGDYKKTFRRLARGWLSTSDISRAQYDEIISNVNSHSWRIWRPVLYVIPREPVWTRVHLVPRRDRGGHGPEYQIADLKRHEFDVIELGDL